MTSAVNEQQVITVTATSGTWTAGFKGQTTAALAEDAAASTVQSALQGLSTIGAGNAVVSGSAGGPYTVTFQGALAGQNVPKIVVTDVDLGGTNHGAKDVTSRPGSKADALNGGVPMHDGDTTEPQGPEDALGTGTKRGDYSGRGDGSSHFVGGVLQSLGPWGDHSSEPNKKGGVTTT